MADVKRLCNIYGRVVHNYRLAFADIRASVILAYPFKGGFGKALLIHKEIQITSRYFHLADKIRKCVFCKLLCDERRSLSHCLRQLKTWQRVISHRAVRRDFYHFANFVFAKPCAGGDAL